VYAFCEIGVIWIGTEVSKRKHRDSLCCPGLLGKYFTFSKVHLIATAKASSDAITAKTAGFF